MEKRGILPFVIGIGAILITLVVVLAQNSNQMSVTASATVAVKKTATSFTMADVAKHNSGSSCWTAINGNVYDVTSWINQHPGGAQSILSLCGIDGSSAFNGQHGGQRRPEAELATFKIGALSS